MNRIGVQLYTVRAMLNTEAEAMTAIRAIKEIGYDSVQLFRTGEMEKTAGWCKICAELGMPINSILGSLEDCEQNAEALFALCKQYNIPDLGISSPIRTEADAIPFIARVNAFAAKAKENGLTFSYHNHGHEFIKTECGKTVMELFLEGFDANVSFMPDTYWIHDGGFDVRRFLELAEGRVKILHMKDLVRTAEGHTFAPVGDGNLYMEGITALAMQQGIEHFVVEQDKCAEDPLVCLQRSYNCLKKLLKA